MTDHEVNQLYLRIAERKKQLEKAQNFIESLPVDIQESLTCYYAELCCQFISDRKEALTGIDEWCDNYMEEHPNIKYTPSEAAAWKAGMQFGNSTFCDDLTDLLVDDSSILIEYSI